MNDLMRQCEEVARQIVDAYSSRWWAARDAINKGTPPAAPTPAEQAQAGITLQQYDIKTLPARKTIEAWAKAGKKGTITVGEEEIEVDFSDIGALQQMDIDLEAAEKSADRIAKLTLDIQRRYGSDMNLEQLQRIKEADPVGWDLRQKLAQKTLEELTLGREAGPEAAALAEKAVRGGQTARGNIYGASNIAQEALSKFDMGQRMLTQRLSQAQAYTMGTPITAQYGAVAGAQQGAAAFAPMQLQPGMGQDPTAAGRGQQGMMQGYGTYVQGMANQSNPWMEGLGMVAGLGASMALGGTGLFAAGAVNNLWGQGNAPRGTTAGFNSYGQAVSMAPSR